MTNNNIKNNKTKTATIITAALVIGLIMSSPMTILPNVSATSNDPSSDCIAKATAKEFSLASQLDEPKAKSLVITNSEFASRTSGYTLTYGGIINTWTIDKTTCNPSWDTVSVVYYLSDVNGKIVKNLVFTMDPQLSKVTKIDEYAAKYQGYSANWSGYQFQADATHSTTITNAYATYSVPSVSKPSGINCHYSSTTSLCDMSIWPGLTDLSGGGNCHTTCHLVQDGTEGIVSCDSSGNNCSTSYDAWYEALPATETVCPSYTVSSGDAMTVQVTQESSTHSSYDFSIYDGSTTRSCTHTVTGQAMTAPVYAPFINEKPLDNNGNYDHLPQFTSVAISGDITYNSSPNSIYTPYSNGYYTLYQLTSDGTSSGTPLINTGAVGTTGSYTETWKASS